MRKRLGTALATLALTGALIGSGAAIANAATGSSASGTTSTATTPSASSHCPNM